MIKKELEIPLRIRKLEAMLRRLLESHPKYADIKNEHGRRLSGYWGEKSLKYYLSFLTEKNYHIFHNLRLPDTSNEHFFEIDILLVTPSFILNIDAKNYRGELHLDQIIEQITQTYEGQKKSFACPLAQINRQEIQLRRLLLSHKFPQAPIESLVIFTNPSAIVTANPNHKQIHKVIKSASFLTKIDTFEKKHKVEVFEKKQIQKLSRFLIKQHTPNDENILEQFGIHQDELLKGVCCPKCGNLPMERTERKWYCPSCSHSSTNAHVNAITDYSLLIDNIISNQKLRKFLQLPSRSAATNILKSLNLQHNNGKKDRVYFFPPNE